MIDVLLLHMTEVNKEKVDSFLKRRERGYYLLRKVDAIPVTQREIRARYFIQADQYYA